MTTTKIIQKVLYSKPLEIGAKILNTGLLLVLFSGYGVVIHWTFTTLI